MRNLLFQFNRAKGYLKSIFSKIMKRLLGEDASETIKTAGKTVGVVLALTTLTLIGIVMFIIALPFGLLGGVGKKPNGIADTFPQVNYATN